MRDQKGLDLLGELDDAARNWRTAAFDKGMATHAPREEWIAAGKDEADAYDAFMEARTALRAHLRGDQ